MLPIQTILHPTDFSERSDHAFQLACSLARDHGARLVILYVVPPPVAHGELVARQQPDSYYDELHSTLERFQPPDPGMRVEHRLEEGEAAAEIVRVAQEIHSDLIVMGTHGRTGLGRLVLGSVAEQVLRRAPCAVLAVKGPFPGASAPARTTAQDTVIA